MKNYARAPNDLGPSLQRYIEHRIPMGGFMTAVLKNNLKEACARADHINKNLIFEIVEWLYNEAPSGCWGSPNNVEAWLQHRDRIIDEEILL